MVTDTKKNSSTFKKPKLDQYA